MFDMRGPSVSVWFVAVGLVQGCSGCRCRSARAESEAERLPGGSQGACVVRARGLDRIAEERARGPEGLGRGDEADGG